MIHGVDVSNHQGRIDWAQVAAAGVVFAALKSSEGLGYSDPTFTANRDGCRAHGIPWFPYHFTRPRRGQDPKAEADRLAFFAGAAHLHYAAIDIEDTATGMTGPEVAAYVVGMAERLEQLGCQPLIYTGAWYLAGAMTRDARLARWPLWLSAYPWRNDPGPDTAARAHQAAPLPWPRWTVWQYTSVGNIPGISGSVDRNIAAPTFLTPTQEDDDMVTPEDRDTIAAQAALLVLGSDGLTARLYATYQPGKTDQDRYWAKRFESGEDPGKVVRDFRKAAGH